MVNVSIAEYAQLLLGHDWSYQTSDDHRAYAQGRAERAWLKDLAAASPDHQVLFDMQHGRRDPYAIR